MPREFMGQVKVRRVILQYVMRQDQAILMSGGGHGGKGLPPMSREEKENKKVIKGSSYKCGVGADYLISILVLPHFQAV